MNTILLSSGSFPWMSLSDIGSLAKKTGFDGIELVPTRKASHDLQTGRHSEDKTIIKSVHHSWKLDSEHDKDNSIDTRESIAFSLIRQVFFPSNNTARNVLSELFDENPNLSLTVHRADSSWTDDVSGNEFKTNLGLEILNSSLTKEAIKTWLSATHHSAVLDTRDDQSLAWAKKNGFPDWKSFWEWIGLNKINNVQVTLIGTRGMKEVFKRQPLLAEEQLLWLHANHWKGSVTLELNPLSLFIASKGDIRSGLQKLHSFIEQTLIGGKNWS